VKEIDPERMRNMEAMAREIAAALGRATARQPGSGFLLLLYSFEGPELTYISNGNREDCTKMLLELLSKWRSEADTTSEQRS
jgi:hypothetical protein